MFGKKKDQPVQDLEGFAQAHRDWSLETFGPENRTKGIIKHLRKEIDEVEQAPQDLVEWIDLMILAVDGYCRNGGKPEELIMRLWEKFSIVKGRSYLKNRDPNEPIEHIRDGEEAAHKEQLETFEPKKVTVAEAAQAFSRGWPLFRKEPGTTKSGTPEAYIEALLGDIPVDRRERYRSEALSSFVLELLGGSQAKSGSLTVVSDEYVEGMQLLTQMLHNKKISRTYLEGQFRDFESRFPEVFGEKE